MWAELRELRDALDLGTPPRDGTPVTLAIDDQPVTVPALGNACRIATSAANQPGKYSMSSFGSPQKTFTKA